MTQVTSSKANILLLLETLLRVHMQHSPGQLPPGLIAGLRELLPALLGCYGASRSHTDRATLRLLLLLDRCMQGIEEGETHPDGTAASKISSLFTGPLAKAG